MDGAKVVELGLLVLGGIGLRSMVTAVLQLIIGIYLFFVIFVGRD